MAEAKYNELVRDLTTLGRAIDPPTPSDGLATEVMDRVAALPEPGRPANGWTWRWRQAGRGVADSVTSRGRLISLVVAAVLLALVVAPPVRAAVAEWFGFVGVLVERGSPVTGTASPPPAVANDQSVSEAAASVDFAVSVPEELGVPDGVEVSRDRRMVSMSWSSGEDGVVRLDQFDASLDFSILKVAEGVFYAAVDETDALWFEEPHEVALLEPDGSRRTESARLAGHTLIWLDDNTTLRLEGDFSLERAVEIAESTVPVE